MKKTLFILLFITTNYFYAQVLKGVVKDSLTQIPLAYSNVVLMNGGGVYTDKNGNFELEIKNSIYDTLKISTIGYKSKLIPLLQFISYDKLYLNIRLESNIEELDEVLISTTKTKYKDKETLGESRDGNLSVTPLPGYESCIFIENPRKKIGKLKRTYIDLKRRKDAKRIALFNIKFYELNKVTNKPGRELYNKKILIKPKNKKYRLWIDVEDLNIKLPAEGIFVGVEIIDPFKKERSKDAYFGPMFRYTYSQNHESITWSNYHNTGWRNGSLTHGGMANPMFGIEVLYPTN